LTYALFRCLIPYQPLENDPILNPMRSAELAHKYRWVDPVLALPFLLFAAAFTWLWTRSLIAFASWRMATLAPSHFLIQPTWVAWTCVGLFLGIVSAVLPLDLLCRLMLRANYAEYMRFSRGKMGFDAAKASIGLVGLVAIAAVGFITLGSNWHLRVTDDYIAWKRFWALGEERYRYDEVKNLILASHIRAPLGNVREQTTLYILFRDGRVWCGDEMGRDVGSEEDKRLLAFLETRLGHPVVQVRLLEDVTH
jgi:hypothetical protein